MKNKQLHAYGYVFSSPHLWNERNFQLHAVVYFYVSAPNGYCYYDEKTKEACLRIPCPIKEEYAQKRKELIGYAEAKVEELNRWLKENPEAELQRLPVYN